MRKLAVLVFLLLGFGFAQKVHLMWSGAITGPQEVGMTYIPASYHIGNIDPPDNDYLFLPIVSYSEQVIALLEYIAKEKPGAKVALAVHPSPFGRAPVPDAKKAAKELGIEIVEVQEMAKGTSCPTRTCPVPPS